jgi:hypothetical protein
MSKIFRYSIILFYLFIFDIAGLNASTAQPPRGRVCLNGPWEYIAVPNAQPFDPLTNRELFPNVDSPFPPVGTDEKPPQGSWTSIQIPSDHAVGYIHPKIPKLWYRRTFTVPLDWRDRQVMVEFAGASFEVVVYVNDHLIDRHRGDATSFSMDITKACRFGKENKLLVRVWCPSIEYGKVWPQALLEDLEWGRKGIWDDVFLQSRPKVSVEHVFCKPSFRKKRMEADVVFVNSSGQDASITTECAVLDLNGKEVLHLGKSDVTIKSGKKLSSGFGKEWLTPRVWMPDDPHLYLLETRVSQGGRIIDIHRERFGFSESWIQGGDFYVNGKIVHYHRDTDFLLPMGDIGNRERWRVYFKEKKALGYNLVRTFRKATPVFLEVADEEGMWVESQSGWHHPANPLTPEFKKNALPVLREWMARDRNHPSLVLWDAENEGYQHEESIIWVMEEMKKLDPTRPIDADSSYYVSLYDDKGKLKTVPWARIANAHYPLTAGLGSYSFTQAAVYPLQWAKNKLKPAFFGEWGDFTTPGVQAFGPHEYEKAMESTRIYFHGQVVSFAGVIGYLEGIIPYWRMLGLSGENDWLSSFMKQYVGEFNRPENWFCPARANLFAPLFGFFPDKTRGVYGGRPFQRKLCIINDTMEDVTAAGEVKLVIQGRDIVKKEFNVVVPQGTAENVPVAFELPKVSVRTPARVEIRFKDTQGKHYALNLDLDIFPPYSPPTLSRVPDIGLYDPKGQTGKALEKLGIPFVKILTPDKFSPAFRILVIGQGCLDQSVVKARGKWLDFMAGGGKVVCLNQKDYLPWLPLQLKVDNVLEVPAVWITAKTNSLFSGIEEGDLSWWANDRGNPSKIPGAVAVSPYFTPKTGRVRSLLETGSNLDRSALLEFRYGKGTALLCQMELIPVIGISPGADILLRHLLLIRSSVSDFPTRQVWFAGDDRARSLLKDRLGISITELSKAQNRTWSNQDLVVWMPESKPLDASLGHIAGQAVEQGAALLAVAPEPKLLLPLSDPPEYKRATEYKDKVYVFQSERHPNFPKLGTEFIKMAAVDREQELLDGLSNSVMCRSSEWLNTGKLADYEIASGRGWKSLTRPAVIAFRKQKGDQVILTVTRESDGTMDSRYEQMIYTLLINLGAVSHDPNGTLVREGSYFTIDLRPYCTMGFTDDKEMDGKGGWSDQGPNNDLRILPVGRQVFLGVPFDIVDPDRNSAKSCVVLGSNQRLKDLPRQVMNIRFGGRKASRIFFLHTGAFGAEGGEYRVHYSKSTEHVETIPLTSSRIGNWWSPSDLPQAPIAWSGTNGANRVGLYMYAWKNPRPDVVIDSIDFISDGQGPILGLFAMTGQE